MSSVAQDAPETKRRPRLHLHVLSWIVLALATASTIILVVPGFPSHSVEYVLHVDIVPGSGPPQDQTATYQFTDVPNWSHGWPFEYLRTANQAPWDNCLRINDYPLAWSVPDAWSLSETVYAFSLTKLLADIVIGVAIVCLAVSGSETWRRRRGRFRISLLDAGIFVVMLSGVLGWWQYHARRRTVEKGSHFVDSAGVFLIYGFDENPMGGGTSWNYYGPDWLQRLLGNSEFLPFCEHVDEVALELDRLTPEECRPIRSFDYLETVSCNGYANPTLWDSLISLPRVHTLNMSSARPEDIPYIAKMPRLETLRLGGDDLLVEDLQILDSCKTLKAVYLLLPATEAERSAFTQSHPRLQIHWADPHNFDTFMSPPKFLYDDPRCVAETLFWRWRSEDSHQKSSEQTDEDHLDLRGIRLTRQRLDRLPLKEFPEVRDLLLGEADAPETVLDLIRRCTSLNNLDVRRIPFTKQSIESIELHELWVSLQQGPLTAQELAEIAKDRQAWGIVVYGSKLTTKEAQEIRDVNSMTYFYTGYKDDESAEVLRSNP